MNPPNSNFRAQVVTVSTRCTAGQQVDRAGPLAAERLAAMGLTLGDGECCPDDRLRIAQAVLRFCDFEPVLLLLLTGGTGPTPDDVTPSAVIGLLERRFEGVEAAIHSHGRTATPHAPLSRVVVGTRNQTVVVAVPGSPGGVRDALAALEPMLSHLLALVRGDNDPH